jgi:ElaB/YqjD/DUF883 family membrane-anchored ribosome-binding protein
MTDVTGDLNGQSEPLDDNTEQGPGRAKRESRSFTDGEPLSGLVRPVLETVRHRAAAARDWAKARGEVAGELVQERPVTAIAAAFGVGMLIGVLARR